jgi:MFS family permease
VVSRSALHLSRAFSIAPTEAGVWLGFMSMIGGVTGAPIAAEISDRLLRRGASGGRLHHFPIFFVLLAVGALIVGFTPVWQGVLAGFLVVATMLAAVNAVTYAAIQDVSPADCKGRMLSLLQFATLAIGYAAGPSLVAQASGMLGDGPNALGLGMVIATIPLSVLGVMLSLYARGHYSVAP